MKKSGITLIALVITIIVLLILAGVTLNMVIGENGVMKQAINAKETHEYADKREKEMLTNLEAAMNQENYMYTDVNNVAVPIPAGFAPTGKEGENTVEEGFVITDRNGNEYVWIEVPKTAEIYNNAGLGITNFEEKRTIGEEEKTNYEWIRKDLEIYSSEYKANDSKDYWYYRVGPVSRNYTVYSKDPLTEMQYERVGTTTEGGTRVESVAEIDETNATSCGLTYAEYTRLYKAMLKSVYENGGFYIGRYEAGMDTTRYTEAEITGINVLSMQDKYPVIYVKCAEAQILANSVDSGNMNSSMLFGLQWDLLLKYLEEKGVALENPNWGNYYDNEFIIERGKYETQVSSALSGTWKRYDEDTAEYVENKVKKAATTNQNGRVLLTTGASTQNKKQNIYDLAGNVWEWTLENEIKAVNCCSYRGGCYR